MTQSYIDPIRIIDRLTQLFVRMFDSALDKRVTYQHELQIKTFDEIDDMWMKGISDELRGFLMSKIGMSSSIMYGNAVRQGTQFVDRVSQRCQWQIKSRMELFDSILRKHDVDKNNLR